MTIGMVDAALEGNLILPNQRDGYGMVVSTCSVSNLVSKTVKCAALNSMKIRLETSEAWNKLRASVKLCLTSSKMVSKQKGS